MDTLMSSVFDSKKCMLMLNGYNCLHFESKNPPKTCQFASGYTFPIILMLPSALIKAIVRGVNNVFKIICVPIL